MPSWREPALMFYYFALLLLAIPVIYALISGLPSKAIGRLALFGEHSMKVYLFHPIAYIGTIRIALMFSHPELSLVATIAISPIIAVIMTKINMIEHLVFPERLSALVPRLNR
jgi:hypothetical protein